MTTTNTKTKSQQMAADIAALLRARNPLIWIKTNEEPRAERYIIEAAKVTGYEAVTWDVGQGVCDIYGQQIRGMQGSESPDAMLGFIRARANDEGAAKTLWICRDLSPWLAGPAGVQVNRLVRNLARSLPGVPPARGQAIVVLSTSGEVPPELSGHATVIEWPMPDRFEIAAILDKACEQNGVKLNGQRDAAIDAAIGLTGEEAAACYAKSIVQFKTVDAAAVSQEKKRVIARERVLEWIDPMVGGLDTVGGLDVAKQWLTVRRSAFSAEARAYGLPTPKGILLVGIAGCGKSLMAKCTAAAYGNIPLLKMDLGALKGKFVGESEANIRKAFKVIESVGRCVVWLDEVEKALQGATSGSSDGGVSADALGAILTWMQERSGEAFVIATSNDISQLPPELLRKGRFDEIFWVDLPTSLEREQVLASALKQNGRSANGIDLKKVALACKDFTGAEIAACVPEAMFTAFNDGARELTTADLLAAAATVVPLSRTAEKKIAGLREWAKGRARPATSPEAREQVREEVRALDMD